MVKYIEVLQGKKHVSVFHAFHAFHAFYAFHAFHAFHASKTVGPSWNWKLETEAGNVLSRLR